MLSSLQNYSAITKTTLLNQVRQTIRTGHYSLRTEEACVKRCKYAPRNHKKRITVELAAEIGEPTKNKERIPSNKIVRIKVRYGEIDIGRKVRALGGNRNKEKKVWELAFVHVQALGLTDRIVTDV